MQVLLPKTFGDGPTPSTAHNRLSYKLRLTIYLAHIVFYAPFDGQTNGRYREVREALCSRLIRQPVPLQESFQAYLWHEDQVVPLFLGTNKDHTFHLPLWYTCIDRKHIEGTAIGDSQDGGYTVITPEKQFPYSLTE